MFPDSERWVRASTCAGSGVLPFAAFPLPCHAHRRAWGRCGTEGMWFSGHGGWATSP